MTDFRPTCERLDSRDAPSGLRPPAGWLLHALGVERQVRAYAPIPADPGLTRAAALYAAGHPRRAHAALAAEDYQLVQVFKAGGRANTDLLRWWVDGPQQLLLLGGAWDAAGVAVVPAPWGLEAVGVFGAHDALAYAAALAPEASGGGY